MCVSIAARAPELPSEVLAAARFGGEVIHARGKFLRVPDLPHGADLYTRQVTYTALRGDVPATLRLSLLPYLASAAAVAFGLPEATKEFGEPRCVSIASRGELMSAMERCV